MYIAGAFEGYIKLAGAGAYNAIGCTESGWMLNEQHMSEPIRSDCAGDAPVSGIQRGTNATLQLTYIEFDLIAAALFATRGGSASAGFTLGSVGKLASTFAFELVLVPVAGTEAEDFIGAGNAYIFKKVLVTGEVVTLLSSRLRKGPLTLTCYPNGSGVTYEIASDPT